MIEFMGYTSLVKDIFHIHMYIEGEWWLYMLETFHVTGVNLTLLFLSIWACLQVTIVKVLGCFNGIVVCDFTVCLTIAGFVYLHNFLQ